MRSMGVPATKEQQLLWDKPVTRDLVCDAIRVLGLEPDNVRSVVMRPGFVEVEEFLKTPDGRNQLDPRDHNTAWTYVHLMPIED